MLSLNPGIIAGGYRLDRLLGKGGMGQVWAATHEQTAQPAALKFLTRPAQLEVATRRRFLREAKAANLVKHPNVVRIHDVFELEDGTPVLVMALLEGETLGQRLERTGRLSVEEAAGLLVPVVSAVGKAHALGIVHRDIKPDNVFLALRDAGVEALVLDFGIAKLLSPTDESTSVSALTGTGTMLGTPAYMAPEQTLCEKDIDHRADIWALGILLYEALTGQRPVDWSNLGQMVRHFMTHRITPIEAQRADLPRELCTLIGKMLARDRAARPSDLREVYDVLVRYTPVRSELFAAPLAEMTASAVPCDSTLNAPVRVAQIEHAAANANTSSVPVESGPGQSLPVRPRTVGRKVSIGVFALILGIGMATTFGFVAPPGSPAREAFAVHGNAPPPPAPPRPLEPAEEPPAAPSQQAPASPSSAPRAKAVPRRHGKTTPPSSRAPALAQPAPLPTGLIDAVPF